MTGTRSGSFRAASGRRRSFVLDWRRSGRGAIRGVARCSPRGSFDGGDAMLRALQCGVLLLLVTAVPAFAQEGSGTGGFLGGFAHPLLGPDHVVAMVAVGLWGAFLRAPAIWLLPIVFPLVMATGGAIAILGVPVPYVEIGIAFSAIALGAMIALAARPPL